MSVKDQVTVALTARRLRGPLYSPRLVVTLGSTGDAHELVVLNANWDGLEEVRRLSAPREPLKHTTAAMWAAYVGDQLYGHLCIAVGVQGELEDLPTATSPPVA